MRIEAQSEEEAPVNLMPLLDMVFLLLIFFLVATTFAQEERELSIQLPGTALSQPLSAPPKQVIINILPDGTAKVSGTVYEYDALETMLGNVARDEPHREILIRCDEQAFHKYFAEVAKICRRAGIGELKIGYILQTPQPVRVQ